MPDLQLASKTRTTTAVLGTLLVAFQAHDSLQTAGSEWYSQKGARDTQQTRTQHLTRFRKRHPTTICGCQTCRIAFWTKKADLEQGLKMLHAL